MGQISTCLQCVRHGFLDKFACLILGHFSQVARLRSRFDDPNLGKTTWDNEATHCYKGKCDNLLLQEHAAIEGFSEKLKSFNSIAGSCGELCDQFSNKPKYNFFINIRKAKVDCIAIFENKLIDSPSPGIPPRWNEIPKRIQDEFTHFGLIKKADWYIDEANLGGDMLTQTVYTSQHIQNMVEMVKQGTPYENYHGGARDIEAAIDQYCNVTGKHILVLGSQSPWIEAILIYKGASKVTTVEFGDFRSEHPQLEYITPQKFRTNFLNGSLPIFDHVFTYSSMEHSGLGRYGDGLNPWGDILSIAKTWCTTSQDARLVIAVPVNYHQECIVFNAHRIYGRILYPFLVTNWKFIWSSAEDFKFKSTSCEKYHQPVYVFRKIYEN